MSAKGSAELITTPYFNEVILHIEYDWHIGPEGFDYEITGMATTDGEVLKKVFWPLIEAGLYAPEFQTAAGW